MSDCRYTNSHSSNHSKENQKEKKIWWTDKMVSQLIEYLAAYKSKMKYQNKYFDADRPMQYKEIRREMAKVYDDAFGPVCLPCRDKNEITQEEEKLW